MVYVLRNEKRILSAATDLKTICEHCKAFPALKLSIEEVKANGVVRCSRVSTEVLRMLGRQGIRAVLS